MLSVSTEIGGIRASSDIREVSGTLPRTLCKLREQVTPENVPEPNRMFQKESSLRIRLLLDIEVGTMVRDGSWRDRRS